MLKQATCAAYGHPLTLALRPLARSTQRHTILVNQRRCFRSRRTKARASENSLSTQDDGAKEVPNAASTPTIDENGLSRQSKNTQAAQTDDKVENSSNRPFVITPRFQWRWRWTFPESRRKEISAQKRITKPEKGGSLEQEAESDRPRTDAFLPTRSEQEQEQLQSVMASLAKMSEDLQPPLSPLEKALEDKEWVPKRQPTKQERQKLSYNPWAMILAGSMRLDAASKTRLPEPLLLPLGQVVKPGTDLVYLLPDDLANLEAYNERLRKGVRRIAMMDLPRANGGTTVKVSPYKPLVDQLTDELTVWDMGKKSSRTKHGIISKRLLPTRWLERAQRVKAYQTASRDYWNLKEKLGETDEQDFKRPEAPSDLMNLQWQPNVAERMQSLMRQRLLLSVDQLGRKVNEPRSRPRRHTMCFDWPEDLFLDVISESTKIAVEDGPSDSQSANYSLAAQHYRPQEQSVASSPGGAVPQPWTPSPTAYHFIDPDVWLPGSCFLHVGPPETAVTALSRQYEREVSANQTPSELSIDKFIPPMIKVNNGLRLPIFNLSALLGSKFDHPLHKVLKLHGMVPPKAIEHNDTPASKNYLILIRATAPGYHYVVRELWQLWRYLDGSDCLNPTLLESPGTHPRTDTRKEKDKLKEYSMPKKGWDQLYAFLPAEIERPPPNQVVKEVPDEGGKS